MTTFPAVRMRRLRASSAVRKLVREHRPNPASMLLPLFVCHGEDVEQPIDGLPGHARVSISRAVALAKEARALGVGGVLLFGIPAEKDEVGSEAYDDEGIVQLATRAIVDAVPGIVVATDVCMCQYTSHGHCGVLHGDTVDNDATLELLARVAVSHARAGAHVIAPSDMMDGRVGAIRRALDEEGFADIAIMSYSAKFASAFYGPFREAAGSAPSFGDRATYQMDPPNAREALREAALDEEEGADILMVKPALAYLDVIARLRDRSDRPIAAYHVSGEYAMVHAAGDRGWIDTQRALMESLTAITRAGADIIITYAALDAARWLQAEQQETP